MKDRVRYHRRDGQPHGMGLCCQSVATTREVSATDSDLRASRPAGSPAPVMRLVSVGRDAALPAPASRPLLDRQGFDTRVAPLHANPPAGPECRVPGSCVAGHDCSASPTRSTPPKMALIERDHEVGTLAPDCSNWALAMAYCPKTRSTPEPRVCSRGLSSCLRCQVADDHPW